MDCSMPVIPVLHHLPEFSQTHVCWIDDAIQPSHPQSPTYPPALNLSQHQGLFKWVSSLHKVAKVLELQHQSLQWMFRIDFPSGLTGLISLQFKGLSRVFSSINSKASILQHSVFFIVQLSHPYRTTGKTTSLTTWTFANKLMSLLFNTLSRFLIAFLPRSKQLLISWLQSPSAVIFRAQENKVCHYFHYFPSIYHEVMGQMPWP